MKNFPKEMKADSGAVIALDSTRLLLKFKKATGFDVVAKRIDKHGLVLEGSTEKELPPQEFLNHTDEHFWVQTSNGKGIGQKGLDNLRKDLDRIHEWIGPVYNWTGHPGRGSLGCPFPDVLVLKPAPKLSKEEKAELRRLIESLSLKVSRRKSAYLGGCLYCQLRRDSDTTAFRVRKELIRRGRGLINEVFLENMPMLVPIGLVPTVRFYLPSSSYAPTDSGESYDYPGQWNMARINAGGPGRTGWDLSNGSPDVHIAIIDNGCDLEHHDIDYVSRGIRLDASGADAGAPVLRQQRMGEVSLFYSASNTPTGHGTCVAGVAAAKHNANGVAGVVGRCQVIPLAFYAWTDVEVARGIYYAVDHGAHVINMSFGRYVFYAGLHPLASDLPSPVSGVWNPSFIDWAINYAHDYAHCVLVACTQNFDRDQITYPASHPKVIGVGGSDRNDFRMGPGNPGLYGESWVGETWGSNYGDHLSVVAPCVQIPTTDISGNLIWGYNRNHGGARTTSNVHYQACGDSDGNYYFLFDGTSSAAPHVSGLAAAIISYAKELANYRPTPNEVRDIIERTAYKPHRFDFFDGYVFAEHRDYPNGRWNHQIGYGRIDMFAALNEVRRRLT